MPNKGKRQESNGERVRRIASTMGDTIRRIVSRQGLDPQKVADRVAGDGFYDGGTNGILSALRQYIFNDDNAVRDRIRKATVDAADGKLGTGPLSQIMAHEDGKRLYLGLSQPYNSFEPSPYRPTIGTSNNPYQLNQLMTDEQFDNLILPLYGTWKTGADWPLYQTGRRVKNMGNTAQISEVPYLKNAGLSYGRDDKGDYISLYDVWDYNTAVKDTNGDNVGKFVNGKPFDIYQRYYLDDWLDIPDEAKGNPFIAPSYIEAERTFDNGGGIHIKPSHRGRLTELKERTGKTEAELYNDGNPAHKKMVVFARNSRKWHADGGLLHQYDGDTEDTGYLSTRYNVVPLGGDYLSYLQSIPEISGGKIEPAVVTAALPSKFNGSQDAARRYAEGYQRGSYPVTGAINSAGHDIFNTVDTVVGFTPTPAGAITWLGHMGADVANGEYGKVGKDLALAAAMGLGLRAVGKGATFLKNYWDEIGNFGEDTFRAFTDKVPGRVSTNFTYAAPAERAAVGVVPTVAKAVSAPYEIENLGGGYMLKSLMRGNPLEKQIGKNGTVNVNNIRALVGKGSKVEQAVVDKVLASEEFAGKKAIDYNKFRKAVQDELITYERTPDTRYQRYGMDRLGFLENGDVFRAQDFLEDNPRLPWHVHRDSTSDKLVFTRRKMKDNGINSYIEIVPDEEVNATFGKWLKDHNIELDSEVPRTYTFSSSRIPNGSSKHYGANTLGHSRTYTTADEPDVLHVMESQSDWAQQANSGSKIKENPEEGYIKELNRVRRIERSIQEMENNLSNGMRPDGSPIEMEYERRDIRDVINREKAELARAQSRFERYDKAINPDKYAQETYLQDNYTSRQIQENLRYAAEKGQTKMRYPTRETAAKIEGYPEQEVYFDANGNDITKSGQNMYEWSSEDYEKVSKLKKEFRELEELRGQMDLEWQGIENSLDPRMKDLISIEYDESMLDQATNAGSTEAARIAESLEKKKAAYKDRWGIEANTEETRDVIRKINKIESEIIELEQKQTKLKPGITKKIVYDYEDILRKYSDFPRQYKKLFKGADVRVVTDPKGNTWYEVDVPENYLQQEWAYKNGGLLHKFDGGGKFMTVSSGYAPLMYTPSPEVRPNVPIPMKYVPQPDNGDYEYPSSTGMLQAYPITTSFTSSPRGFVIADEVPGAAAQAVYNDEANKAAREERMWRQWYAESAFNNSAKSPAGAQGAFQIMPITYKDYLGRGKGKPGDLNNPAYNRKVRDFVLGIIPRDLGAFWSDDSSDEINLAKRYAAYNWGAGSLRNYLRKKQKEGYVSHLMLKKVL